MIVKLLPLLLLILKTSRCSLVIDKFDQWGVHLKEFCPNMKFCREGAHVMCLYYNPKKVYGPRCFNPTNVTMIAPIAGHLLDIANSIRSQIAQGKETGKDGKLLPRGYGIFRLKWDSELATFAQVLANQCILRHDLCRATKRFPHPSQTIGVVRFTYPDWLPLSNGTERAKGLTRKKIDYAINTIMKSWYYPKSQVTEQMILTYPDWAVLKNLAGRLYLDMIHGSATHMGCGMSGYSEFVNNENPRQGIQNSLQVVCNFSSGARKGTNVYETEPPIPGQGYSAKCGCPPGSQEDADCLCIERTPEPSDETPQPTCPFGETSSYCDPALVLLPIFTIEDAPPEKLYQFGEEIHNPLKNNYILQRVNNTSDAAQDNENNVKPAFRAQSSNDLFDIFNDNGAENAIFQHPYKKSSVQSTAPPYRNNTIEAIFGNSRFKPKARARTSQELLEFIRKKGKEVALSWPHANKPSSVEFTEFNNLYREQQSPAQFRLAPDLKPPALPPPPPRRPPAHRPAPPARPHPHHRPPPPPPRLPPPPRIPPPPPPPIEKYSTALQTHVKPRPANPASRDRKCRPPPKLPPKLLPKHHQMKKKASVFTRVEQFQLPKRRRAALPFKIVKKDVEPRKDFSNLNQVVNDYLKRHPGYKIINGNNEQTLPTKDIKPHAVVKAQTDAVEIETGLNRVEESVINFNQYSGQKNSSNYNDKDVDIKDDNDNKLLSLLDTLEREVKHIALDGDEKQLFDAKLRKIYGSIIGRTAQQMFPKPIPFSIPDPGAAEIDFGETKSRDQLEPNPVENDHLKVIDEPKQKKRFKIEQKVKRVKHLAPSVKGHKWKNKYMESFDQKKYNPDVSNNKIQHNENLNKIYNENHLDHEYNEVPRKFDENFDHPHHYNIDRKYDDDEPIARSKMYQADRDVFRGLEKKHKKRVKSLGSRNEDILSVERRTYYQEKIDNIKRKLLKRKNGRKNDPKNDQSLRRMHMKNRESSRMRSKDQADNFYMPERARFLNGF